MMVRLEGYGKKTAGGSLSFQLWDQPKMGRGRILAGAIMHCTAGNATATSRSARHVMVVDKRSSKDKVIEDLSAVGYEGNIYSLDNFASFLGKKEGLKHVSVNFKNNRRKQMLGRSSAAIASSAGAPVGSGGAAASSSAAPFKAQKDNADFEDDVDMENEQGAEADPAKLGGGAAASSSAAVVSPKAFKGDVDLDGDADLLDGQAVEAAGSSGVPVDGVAIIEYSEMGWTLGGNAGKKGADKTELVKQVVRWFNDGGGHGMLIFDDAHKLCTGTAARSTARKAGGADVIKEQAVIADLGKDTKNKKPSPKAKGKPVPKAKGNAKIGKKCAKEELAISSDDESSSDDPLQDLMGMPKKLQRKKAPQRAGASTMKRTSKDTEFEGPDVAEIDQNNFSGPNSNSVKNAVMLVRECPSAKIVTASGAPAKKLQGLAHLMFRSGLWPMLNAAKNPATTESPLTAGQFNVGEDAEVEKKILLDTFLELVGIHRTRWC